MAALLGYHRRCVLRRLATPPALALGACIILPAFANPAWIDRLLHERLPHDTQAFWMGQWLFWEYLVFGAAYYTLGIWAANHAAWLQTQSKRALHALIVSGLLACSWYGLALRVSAFFACGSLQLSLAVFCLALQTTRPPPLWIGGLSLGIYKQYHTLTNRLLPRILNGGCTRKTTVLLAVRDVPR